MTDHDPITDPRPEDLESYGIGQALLWFAGLLAVALAVYFLVFK